MGIAVADDFAGIGRDTISSAGLYVIAPILKAMLWETVAALHYCSDAREVRDTVVRASFFARVDSWRCRAATLLQKLSP
jgi:hypothetical protein